MIRVLQEGLFWDSYSIFKLSIGPPGCLSSIHAKDVRVRYVPGNEKGAILEQPARGTNRLIRDHHKAGGLFTCWVLVNDPRDKSPIVRRSKARTEMIDSPGTAEEKETFDIGLGLKSTAFHFRPYCSSQATDRPIHPRSFRGFQAGPASAGLPAAGSLQSPFSEQPCAITLPFSARSR